MTALTTVLIIVFLLLAGMVLGWLMNDWFGRTDPSLTTKDQAEAEYNEHQSALLTRLLDKTRGSAGIRYEIELSDWGPEQGEMRWRWVAWDADRYLTVILDPDVDAIGREIPAMLGNAPTKVMALRDANLWVMDQGQTAVVVTPPPVEP